MKKAGFHYKTVYARTGVHEEQVLVTHIFSRILVRGEPHFSYCVDSLEMCAILDLPPQISS